MKNNILPGEIDGIDAGSMVLNTLKLIEQKLEKEITAKQELVEWQRREMDRFQRESTKKNDTISELHAKLSECSSHIEGYRQLVNKLIFDIDRLQQNVDWYKRTYESRSLFGVIKDKLKHLLS